MHREDSINALQAALIKCHGALAKWLIEKGADANKMALSDAPWASDCDDSSENLSDDENDIQHAGTLNKNSGISILGMFSINDIRMKFCDLNEVVGKVCHSEVWY